MKHSAAVPWARSKRWAVRLGLLFLIWLGPLALPCRLVTLALGADRGVYHWHWNPGHVEQLEVDGATYFASSQTLFCQGGLRLFSEPGAHGGFFVRRGTTYLLYPWNLWSWMADPWAPPWKREAVTWGRRRYLIPEHAMDNFRRALKDGWEPRRTPTGLDAIYLRSGDHSVAVEGSPVLPRGEEASPGASAAAGLGTARAGTAP